LGIQAKKLSAFLISNSIIADNDEISSITVDDKKELVKFEGTSIGKFESDTKAIHFSASFDEIDEPIAIKQGKKKSITILDEEVEDDKIRDDKPDDKKSEAKESD